MSSNLWLLLVLQTVSELFIIKAKRFNLIVNTFKLSSTCAYIAASSSIFVAGATSLANEQMKTLHFNERNKDSLWWKETPYKVMFRWNNQLYYIKTCLKIFVINSSIIWLKLQNFMRSFNGCNDWNTQSFALISKLVLPTWIRSTYGTKELISTVVCGIVLYHAENSQIKNWNFYGFLSFYRITYPQSHLQRHHVEICVHLREKQMDSHPVQTCS